jgi:hypothetical protein
MRPNGQAFQQSLYELELFKEQRNDVVKRFTNAPIQSTLLGFSKITNIVRDVLKPSDTNSNLTTSQFDPHLKAFKRDDHTDHSEHHHKNNKHSDLFNHPEEDSELMDSMTSDNIHLSNNDGFEMVTKVNFF